MFWNCWRWRIWYFWAKKLMEIWYLLITEKFLFWSFWEWEILSFLIQKLMERWYLLIARTFLFWTFRWWKNTVALWVKKLMERWYLLLTEKFLFWTFRWLEIRSFFDPKIWWKDYIYLVFLNFPWYSRTWKIWFFVQCKNHLVI